MNPIQQNQTAIKNTINEKITQGGICRMWGFSIEFWESVLIWATVLAAIAGAISVTSIILYKEHF